MITNLEQETIKIIGPWTQQRKLHEDYPRPLGEDYTKWLQNFWGHVLSSTPLTYGI